jgi:16S rRNA (adenine1518-N6/adenine1519-N6)-dimethyltransferase
VAQTKQQIQSLLTDAGSHPRHRFGQNFMIDQNLVRLIADTGGLTPGDLALEVGPGTGTLTEELLARAGEVVSVEIDRDLAAMLRRKFESEARFTLVEGDALAGKHGLNADLAARIAKARGEGRVVKLVANLPYNIASPLVIELLIAGVETLAFTVQKEVADRLRSKASDEAYGPLTAVAQMLAEIEVLRTLPPQAFWPAPKIDSALVRMKRRDRAGDRARPFGQFVHTVFSFRRKTLKRALAQGGFDAAKILTATGIDGQVRPEVLTPEQMWEMFLAAQT